VSAAVLGGQLWLSSFEGRCCGAPDLWGDETAAPGDVGPGARPLGV
jgi:hypothetical protein